MRNPKAAAVKEQKLSDCELREAIRELVEAGYVLVDESGEEERFDVAKPKVKQAGAA